MRIDEVTDSRYALMLVGEDITYINKNAIKDACYALDQFDDPTDWGEGWFNLLSIGDPIKFISTFRLKEIFSFESEAGHGTYKFYDLSTIQLQVIKENHKMLAQPPYSNGYIQFTDISEEEFDINTSDLEDMGHSGGRQY